jgi:hypothetical protein
MGGERNGGLDGRDEVGRHPDGEGDDDGEGDGHRGQGAADEEPGSDPEGEPERCVPGRRDARGEAAGRERGIARVRLVDGASPPVRHEAEHLADDDGGRPGDDELGGQPADAGYALGPRQAEGAGLELAGDQRRPRNRPAQPACCGQNLGGSIAGSRTP